MSHPTTTSSVPNVATNDETTKITGPAPFEEFKDELGEVMNCEKVLTFVCDKSLADKIEELFTECITAAGSKCEKVSKFPKISFITTENQGKFEECTAVHQQIPLVGVIDMDNDASFIQTLKGATYCDTKMKKRITYFLENFEAGNLSRAKQGVPRPLNDECGPNCCVQVPHMKIAVQCSFQELVHEAPGDVLVLLYSCQCPCCPEALKCMDAFVAAVRDQDASIKISAVCCNIEQNELDDPDWPSNRGDQVVPMIKYYVNCNDAPDGHPCGGANGITESHRKNHFTFTGVRECDRLMNFVVEHATVLPATFSREKAIEAWTHFKTKRKRE